jgi:uncharacterized membrane protein YccC
MNKKRSKTFRVMACWCGMMVVASVLCNYVINPFLFSEPPSNLWRFFISTGIGIAIGATALYFLLPSLSKAEKK